MANEREKARPTFHPNLELWAPQTPEEQETQHNEYWDNEWYREKATALWGKLQDKSSFVVSLPVYGPIVILNRDDQIDLLTAALKEIGI